MTFAKYLEKKPIVPFDKGRSTAQKGQSSGMCLAASARVLLSFAVLIMQMRLDGNIFVKGVGVYNKVGLNAIKNHLWEVW